MKRYWDLSEKDRAALEESQVAEFLATELMENGVTNPVAPELLDESAPQLAKHRYWTVSAHGRYGMSDVGLLFDTMEDAEKFIAIKCRKSDYDYKIGDKYTFAVELTNHTISPVEVYDKADVDGIMPALQRAAENREANKKARKEYDAAVSCKEECCSNIWGDWHECCAKQRRYQRILDTFAEYRKLCDGNADIARTFLGKAYSEDEIAAAGEWMGDAFLSARECAAAAEPVAAAVESDDF